MGLFNKIKSAFTGTKNEPDKVSNEASTAKDTSLEPKDQQKETNQYEKGLKKSRTSFTRRLNELLANFRYEDAEFFEELEDLLIEADVGFEATMQIADTLRYESKVENVRSMADAERVIVQTMVDMYGETNPDHHVFNENPDGLTVILFV